MTTPLIKSLYKFKQLSGKHPLFDMVFILIARAGEETYIDDLLEELPNCAAFFENIDDENARLTKFFFPDKPNSNWDEIVGSYTDYQGSSEIFLSQTDGQGRVRSICIFRRGKIFELCEMDSEIMLSPQNVDLDNLKNQHKKLSESYTEVKTSKDAVSLIWNIGEEIEK